MMDAIVAFSDGHHGEELYGPCCFQINRTLIKNNENPKIPSQELMSAKLEMLQYQSAHAQISDTSLSTHSYFAITSWASKMSFRPDPLTSYEFSASDKEKITRVVKTVLYPNGNTKLKDVEKTLKLISTFIALDDSLRPTTVFPGFWYPGMIVAPHVIIEAPRQDRERWYQCDFQLRRAGLQEFAFRFQHSPSGTYEVALPTHKLNALATGHTLTGHLKNPKSKI
ncbi:hypothetical protein CHU98_g12133 [Xylaria longipes]|nr:hypothetical protein CHU98_g12133 [Xylaria longipes]